MMFCPTGDDGGGYNGGGLLRADAVRVPDQVGLHRARRCAALRRRRAAHIWYSSHPHWTACSLAWREVGGGGQYNEMPARPFNPNISTKKN